VAARCRDHPTLRPEQILLAPEQLARLKPDAGFISIEKEGELLELAFYDPSVFAEQEHVFDGVFLAMDGGFPSYFRATVNLRTWQVSHFYGSEL